MENRQSCSSKPSVIPENTRPHPQARQSSVYNLATSDGTPGWTVSYFHFVKKNSCSGNILQFRYGLAGRHWPSPLSGR